ncbi:hypothetical protein [Bartonella vinsonii]|nr:hypothetical protein [Bartonella vinsonii]
MIADYFIMAGIAVWLNASSLEFSNFAIGTSEVSDLWTGNF